MRENDVRIQVSGARSAQNDFFLISSAVRQTPLTETLCPVFSSFGVWDASMVMRRFSPRCSIFTTLPTSSTIPVNMRAVPPKLSSQHHDFVIPSEAKDPLNFAVRRKQVLRFAQDDKILVKPCATAANLKAWVRLK